jgi:hypothetical protein
LDCQAITRRFVPPFRGGAARLDEERPLESGTGRAGASGRQRAGAAAIELDRNESERFSTFDGGTLQFQTTF